jgi:hypothetical protein
VPPKRESGLNGLSYADANPGRLIKEGPDVQHFLGRIEETWPELEVYYDCWDLEWVVTQHDRKGNETLVLTDKDLARAYERLQRADNAAPGSPDAYNLNELLEREQAEAKEKDMEDFRVIARDAGERLIHAFKKDGLLDHEDIYGPKPKKNLAKRDVRIREHR